MIDGIYNYLVPNYTSKSSPRPEIHKRSELRSIYNSIVNKSKVSPLYSVNMSEEKQQFALGIKEAALTIHSSINHLCGSEHAKAFSYQNAVTTSSAVTASIITDNYEELPEEFSIEVDQLASAQHNTGANLYMNATGPLNGSYAFEIRTPKDAYTFQFQVERGMKNTDILEKLSNSINDANIGVQSFLTYTKSNSTLQMELKSELTGLGTTAPFYLRDISSPKTEVGLVEFYELDYVTTKAANAEFRVNGEPKESMNNEFLVNHALSVSLNRLTDGPTHILYKPDSKRILQEVYNFSKDYNDMVDFVQENKDEQRLAKNLLSDMQHVHSTYRNELESVGISFSPDEKMKIDEFLASQAIEDGDLQKALNKPMGFPLALSNKMRAISIDPLEYIDKKLVIYPNFSKPGVANPYMTSLYSGALFNYYC